MNTDQDSIILNWLQSLGMPQYAAAFCDNGYDELEVCKLIKDEDLDAIGVTNPLHRKIILDSVHRLKCEGATSVYFTLEEVNRAKMHQRSLQKTSPSCESTQRDLIYDVSPRPNHSAFVQTHSNSGGPAAYSTAAISLPLPIERLVRSKLEQEQVDVRSLVHIQAGERNVSMLTALAMRYAEELSQDYLQVLSVLESLSHPTHQHLPSQQGELRGAHSETHLISKDICEMSLGSRQPPAVPTSPPPLNTHQISKESVSNPNFKPTHQSLHYLRSQPAANFHQPIRMASQPALGDWNSTFIQSKEPTSGRSRHFQGPPCFERRPPGCTCYQMQMSQPKTFDDAAALEHRRKEALVQAKAGRLSAEQAMLQIRQCEKERSDMTEKKVKKKSATTKLGEFFKFPSFRRKSKQPEKQGHGAKSNRSMSCSDTFGPPPCAIGPSLSTSQLANDLKINCSCGLPPAMHASRSMNFSPCSCDECLKIRSGMMQVPPPPSPMLSHRSAPVRCSARYPSNRRVNADIVRAPPTCRQCNAPLNQPQKVLPKFYSPQVTRKTYQPLTSPIPHHYNKPVVDKFEAWYQQNLPSDDETRHLIDPNQSDDTNSINNTSFDAFVQSSRSALASPPLVTAPRPAFAVVKDIPGVNNPAHSYHSDSLSSEDLSTRQQRIKQQSGSEASPSVVRGRRDSGCYLSNENLNNNSSNSSTCEKKGQGFATPTQSSKASADSSMAEKLRKQMAMEGIDLTRYPYTDENGHWCVPMSLVSRYATLYSTDLTTVALKMDAARCYDLQARQQQCVPLSADTRRNPEQKRVSSVKEFLVLSGLPMYTDKLLTNGYDTLGSLANMNEEKLKSCGVTDPIHVEIIMSAINSTWHCDASKEQLNTVEINV
ncbi:uncharacterized protein [Watersipora subatra]|uniref:uncharacterized protein isoform X1 n=1 Tax=Watersipora subatra TaxID=2589382 RepID=UPI00355ACE6F